MQRHSFGLSASLSSLSLRLLFLQSRCFQPPQRYPRSLSPINQCRSHLSVFVHPSLTGCAHIAHPSLLNPSKLQPSLPFAVAQTPDYLSISYQKTSSPPLPTDCTMIPGERSTSSRRKPDKKRPEPALTEDFQAATAKLDRINSAAMPSSLHSVSNMQNKASSSRHVKGILEF
jgi:hypothetical protein